MYTKESSTLELEELETEEQKQQEHLARLNQSMAKKRSGAAGGDQSW